MSDELAELFNMLSMDRDDVREIKKNYEQQLSILLGNVRSLNVQNISLINDYDINTEFDKFKIDDISLRYKLHAEAMEYKISLLQSYIKELNTEKKFLEYRRKKEEELSKDDYLSYVNDINFRTSKLTNWLQEFNK